MRYEPWEVSDDVLVAAYRDGLSIYDLAIYLDRSVNGVYRKLRRLGVTDFRKNLKPPVMRGTEHPRWKGGGTSFQRGRTTKEYRERRAEILKRDGCCTECGSTDRLHVHHRSDPRDHSLENLVTLCSACHIQLHAPHKARWG